MQALPRSRSRFECMPAWQCGAVLALTTLAICLGLLLVAEAAVRIRNEMKYGGNFWGIDETYQLDPATGLRMPIPNSHFGPIRINSFGFRGPQITKEKPPGCARVEHVFAAQKCRIGPVVRTVGLVRARVTIGLANLAYNSTRLAWLNGRTAPA